MNSSANWTGRTARTLTDAFGPYSRLTVQHETPKTPLSYKVIYLIAVAVGIWMCLKADGVLG